MGGGGTNLESTATHNDELPAKGSSGRLMAIQNEKMRIQEQKSTPAKKRKGNKRTFDSCPRLPPTIVTREEKEKTPSGY